MASYTKVNPTANTTIEAVAYGQHVETQYECAQAEYEAGNWTKPTDIALAVSNTHRIPCPVKASVTASQAGEGTDTKLISPSNNFVAFSLEQFVYNGTFGANQSGTVKAIMSDDSEITLLTISTTATATKTLKDILDAVNAKSILYIKAIEVEVVGASGASGTASLAVDIYGYQH